MILTPQSLCGIHALAYGMFPCVESETSNTGASRHDSAAFFVPVIWRESVNTIPERGINTLVLYKVSAPATNGEIETSSLVVIETAFTGVFMISLTIQDLNTTINHEPRIQDILIAERLGFSQVRDIRKLIDRNIDELRSYGEVSATSAETPNLPRHGGANTAFSDLHGIDANTRKAGRPSKTYFLNEGQALVICALSRTPNAASVRKAIIEVYMAYRKGTLPLNSDLKQLIITATLFVSDAVGQANHISSRMHNAGYPDSKREMANLLRILASALSVVDALGRASGVAGVKQLPAKTQGRLPMVHKPVDAKAIHESCDELFVVLGHFKMMTQQSHLSKAATKVHNILLDAAQRSCETITREVVHHC